MKHKNKYVIINEKDDKFNSACKPIVEDNLCLITEEELFDRIEDEPFLTLSEDLNNQLNHET